MNTKKGLEWLLKHKKDPLGKKELEHHMNLKAVLAAGYVRMNGDHRLGLFQKKDDWVIYDHTLERCQDAYINGKFHHSVDEIHRLIGIKKRPRIDYV